MTALVEPTTVLEGRERAAVLAERASGAAEGRVVALDGIRGVAVLSVIAFHWLAMVGHHNAVIGGVIAGARAGWVGVELFFVLSGFLITGILADAKEGATSARRYFGTFYGRRCLRIFPLYYGVIAVILLAGFVVPGLATEGWQRFVRDQGWVWLYGVNVGIGAQGAGRFEYDWFDLTHFWSLAVEEHFYLVWPVVMWGLSRRGAMGVSAAVFAGSLALRAWGPVEGSGWVRGLLATPMSAGGLAAGAMVALWLRSGVETARAGRAMGWVAVIGVVGVAAVGGAAGGLLKEMALVKTVGVTMLGVTFAGVVGYVACGGDRVSRRVLESRGLVVLGKYSYGLYVFHCLFGPVYRGWELGAWFGRYLPGVMAYLAVLTVATVGMTLVSWNLYEKQFLRLKGRLVY